MTASSGPVDYAKAYFIHPTLTPIPGEPDYSTLKILKKELKANASRVTSDLGGGGHGHLGLVLTAHEYAMISAILYARPVHPGALTIPPGTTNHEANRLTLAHTESVRVYHETVELEKTLINLTCNAIKDTYYRERINPHTSTVTEPLANFLTWLFSTYGDIDHDSIKDEERRVSEILYDLQNPITTVFEPIQELEQLAIAGNRPYTQAQLVDFGVAIISNTHDFENALLTWHAKDHVNQTWTAFKAHFTTARKFLRKVRGKTMRSAGFHQANMLAENLDSVRHEVLNEVHNVQNVVANAMSNIPHSDESTPAPQIQTANAVTTNSDMATLVAQISALSAQMQQMKSGQGGRGGGRGNGGGRHGRGHQVGRGGNGGRNPQYNSGSIFGRHPRWHRSNTSLYCWTHGACNHASSNCLHPLPGHRNNATFANRMNGCDFYCQNVTDNNINEIVNPYIPLHSINSNYIIAKADSGATSNYWREKDKSILHNLSVFEGPTVTLPDNSQLQSKEEGEIPLSPLLSTAAKKASVIPGLKSASLISLGQIVDDGCTILLDEKTLLAFKNKQLVMQGNRNNKDGLWDIPIFKRKFSPQNYILPKIHADMYPSRTSHLSNAIHSPRIKKLLKPVSKNANSFQHLDRYINEQIKRDKQHNILPPHLQDMECLAQYNSDKNRLCAKQNFTQIQYPSSKCSVILRKRQTHSDLADYLHAACFGPVKSTFSKAIKKGFFKTWPGLSERLLQKHLHPAPYTAKGHISQTRQHLQSTHATPRNNSQYLKNIQKNIKALRDSAKPGDKKSLTDLLQSSINDDAFPSSDTPNIKRNEVTYALFESSPTGLAYIDLTGRFPYRSARGNEYILVGYHYDANAILSTALKNRQAATITKAWTTLNDKFKHAGVTPTTCVIDNEASMHLKCALRDDDIKHQLVPPHCHRTNLAERAIQTFKQHFKTGLALCDPDFPLSQWDRLLPQAEMTLNMLRASRINPQLSAYAYLFGEFDFNVTPLAPPGTRVVAHIKPAVRGTWAPNGEDAWYIGPSMQHYRCVNCYFPHTKATRDVDTVMFFPSTVPFPKVKIDDFLRQAATDIISILQSPPSTTVPSLQAGDEVQNAILKLATILNRVEATPPPPILQPIVQPPPRVLHPSTDSASAPRVVEPKLSPSQQLSQTQKWKKPTTQQNRYNLRSTNSKQNTGTNFRHLAARTLLAQHIVNNQKYSPSSISSIGCSNLAHHIFDAPTVSHIYNSSGTKLTIKQLLSGSRKDIWMKALSMEIGRLAQGNDYGVTATDTIEFIPHHLVPSEEKVTYASFVADHRPLKPEPDRIRCVAGGDKLDYFGDSSSPTTTLTEAKLLFNSVISDASQGARFMTCDLKDHFLASPMKQPRYMRMRWDQIPDDIKLRYNLHTMKHYDYVYVKIKKGMYGLKEAAILAYNKLLLHLTPRGYYPIEGTAGMWRHKTRKTIFCLCVDDFGIKYFDKEDVTHFQDSLKDHFKFHLDWEGKNYIGLQLDWNYDLGYVDISMPNYILKILKRLCHPTPSTPQYSPHEHFPVIFGGKGTRQYATAPDLSPPLPSPTYIQQVVGSLLYYARALDNTILPALNDISTQQSKPTENSLKKCKRLLDYVSTYDNTFLRYHKSNMILTVDSDAAYLVAPGAKSRIAGFFYFKQAPNGTILHPPNSPVHVECRYLRHVVASAAEAEVGGLFHNCQTAIPLRNCLIAMGHPQPPTPTKTDNTTAEAFTYNNITIKKAKSWDMRYFWLRDREKQKHFKIYWKKGTDVDDPNYADYHTKHHSVIHHKGTRHIYIHDKVNTISSSPSSYHLSPINKYPYVLQHVTQQCHNIHHLFTRLRGCIDLHNY